MYILYLLAYKCNPNDTLKIEKVFEKSTPELTAIPIRYFQTSCGSDIFPSRMEVCSTLIFLNFFQIGALEGQAAIKLGLKDDLSEQELVDCSKAKGNEGCHGGLMTKSFTYIKAHGIATLKSYPYVAKKKSCAKGSKPRAHINVTDFKKVSANESVLEAAVGKLNVKTILRRLSLFSYESRIN